MNGISKITVKGVDYPLYFNVDAVSQIASRTINSNYSSSFKIMVDLIYGGMIGWAGKNDLQYPEYQTVYELCEAFVEEDDSSEQYANIDKCFAESKWGSDFINQVNDVKKKAVSLTKKPTGKTSESTA